MVLVSDNNWLGRLPAIVSVIAITLIASYAFSFSKHGWSNNPDSWGQFGDFLGGLLNPLISLFTLTVAVKVWQLQKTELSATRSSLDQSLEISKTQSQVLKIPRFEQTLFALVDQLRNPINSILIATHFNRTEGAGDLLGLEAIVQFLSGLRERNPGHWDKSDWFDNVVKGRDVKKYQLKNISLGIKELLSFIFRTHSDQEVRKIYCGVSLGLLGLEPFELAYEWSLVINDGQLTSDIVELRKLQPEWG